MKKWRHAGVPALLALSLLLTVAACGVAPSAEPADDGTGAEATDVSVSPVTPVAELDNPHLRETEEEFKREFARALIPRRQWPETDFRRHTVDMREFLGGGVPKDGIPAIDRPAFVSVQEADQWLEDREPVQVVEVKGDVRAYPLQILIWHELVNDVVGGEPVVVTY